jgi:hypothetical protein
MTEVTKAISEITDRALFEQISVDILRHKDEKYFNTIHGGVNEKGETITSPLDAFHKIGETEFVLIEVTTNDTNLNQKWLSEKIGKEGDLIKAAKKANEWKKSYPEARYTVLLCTNQRIKDILFTNTNKKAKELGLNVEYLEQSGIVSYLEDTANGQWLAEKHLGITARRLSIDKLKTLCAANHADYQREIYFDNSKIITRSKKEAIRLIITKPETSICLLIGDSGVGKSTLSAGLLTDFVINNQGGIRLKPEIVEQSVSILDAIEKQLKSYQSNIRIEADIFNHSNKFLVVIDDVNKLASPVALIEKILNWEKRYPFVLLCPIWRHVYNQLPERFRSPQERCSESKPPFLSIDLDVYTEMEAFTFIQARFLAKNISLSKKQFEFIAKSLSFNPFLLDTYSELTGLNTENYALYIQNPIGKYIEEQLKTLENKSNFAFYELENSLFFLANYLLIHKNLEVSCALFDVENKKFYNVIGKQNKVLRIDKKGNIIFKHDKIRDFLLVQQIEKYLIPNDLERHDQVLREPYFAELIGRAIGNLDIINDHILNYFFQNQPLAVFESLRYIQGTANETSIHGKVVNWVRKNIKNVKTAELNAIEQCLMELDYAKMLEITNHFDTNYNISVANFRNGDIESGMRYLSYYSSGRSGFEPSLGNDHRDKMIEHFNVIYKSNKISNLKLFFQKKEHSNKRNNHLILLAGYTKSPKLFKDIFNLWKTCKEELLTSTMWALAYCFSDDYQKEMYEVFDFWSTFPKDVERKGIPTGRRDLSAFQIRRCVLRDLCDNFVDFLLEISKNDIFSDLVWAFLYNIDNPKAFEYVVLKLAKTGISGLWFPNRAWKDSETGSKQISTRSLKKLASIWGNENESEAKRYYAFQFWSINTQDLKSLQTIDKKQEYLHKDALRKRLLLKDESALNDAIYYIEKKNVYGNFLLAYLLFIWNRDVMQFIDNQIEKNCNKLIYDSDSDKSWMLREISYLLAHIPPRDLDLLLSNHWDKLRYNNDFIQLALLAGTQKCKALVADSFYGHPNPKVFFDGFNKRLSRMRISYVPLNVLPLTMQALQTMKPYFEYMEQTDIETLLELAYGQKLQIWVKQNLIQYIDKQENKNLNKKIYNFPTDNDIEIEFLNLANENRNWQLRNWVERLENRNCNKARLMLVLQKCLEKHGLQENLIQGIGKCIELIGNRSDIAILESPQGSEHFKSIIDNVKYNLFRRTLK